MATGYNDPGTNFASAIDQIMAEAARQGIRTVMWLTLRTAPVGFVPSTYRSTSGSFRDNNLIMLQKAQQYAGRSGHRRLGGFSAGHQRMVRPRRYPLPPAGAQAAAQFLATSLRRVFGGENITPTRTGPRPGRRGASALRYGRHRRCRAAATADRRRHQPARTASPASSRSTRSMPCRPSSAPTGSAPMASSTRPPPCPRRLFGAVDRSAHWRPPVAGRCGSNARLMTEGSTRQRRHGVVRRIGTFYAVQTFQRRQGLPSQASSTATGRAPSG